MSPETEMAIQGLARRVYALEQAATRKLELNSGDVWGYCWIPHPEAQFHLRADVRNAGHFWISHKDTPGTFIARVPVEETAKAICRSLNRHKACEDLLKQILAEITKALEAPLGGYPPPNNKPLGLDYRSLQVMIRELVK